MLHVLLTGVPQHHYELVVEELASLFVAHARHGFLLLIINKPKTLLKHVQLKHFKCENMF